FEETVKAVSSLNYRLIYTDHHQRDTTFTIKQFAKVIDEFGFNKLNIAQKIIEKIGKSKFIKANIRSSNLELLSKTTWETFLLEFNKAVETDDDNNGDGDIDM
ncbi:21968_t:CDS:2, partial [Entrophospora sp. SA101]